MNFLSIKGNLLAKNYSLKIINLIYILKQNLILINLIFPMVLRSIKGIINGENIILTIT